MVPNDEDEREKECLRNEIKRLEKLIKNLHQFVDVTKVPDPIIRKPVIDKIRELIKEIQEYEERLGELDKKS